MKVGFIGLGSIGIFMARRLARVGFEVTGCDIKPDMLARFDEPGTRREADPIATARGQDVLGICVLNDAQVESLCGDGALFAALGEGGIAVIHSTVSPDLARRLAQVAKPHGVGLVDAGVSPGGHTIEAGESSVFVGGDDATVARARPYLEAFGTVTHLGPLGRGLEGKIVHNLASIAGFGLAASIMEVARGLDFDEAVLRQAMMRGTAQSYALMATPGLLNPSGPGATGTVESLHDLLKKDVDHAMDLAGWDNRHARVLRASAQAMLDALRERDGQS